MSDREERIETRVVHAGLDPDPTFGSITPAIHQTSTFVQPAPGQFVEDYDYSRSANPTRAALEKALGELEGGYATARPPSSSPSAVSSAARVGLGERA